MSRFETQILTTRKNLKSLTDLAGMWIDHVGQHRSLDKLTLDLLSGIELIGLQRAERNRFSLGFRRRC